jgi:hypothetical protein
VIADPPADGPPVRPARGLRGWFGGLSRIRKLILTWSASVLAVVIALPRPAGHRSTRWRPAPRRSPSPSWGTRASTSRWPSTPATRCS